MVTIRRIVLIAIAAFTLAALAAGADAQPYGPSALGPGC